MTRTVLRIYHVALAVEDTEIFFLVDSRHNPPDVIGAAFAAKDELILLGFTTPDTTTPPSIGLAQ
jgi:hypothetical protein